MATKVLLIGVDSGTFDLILPWAKEGYLPNIKKILENGVHGPLKDSWLAITAPRWTTIVTGKNPGKHGVFDFGNMTPAYRTKPVSAENVDAKPIQDILTEAGRRVAMLNVPNTHPVRPVNGVMIAGVPAPELDETTAYPPALLDSLKKGGYVILSEEVYEKDNEAKMIGEMNAMLEKQQAVALKLAEKDWDFFFYVFFATDMAGHWFWKHMDKSHPLHQKRDERFENTIRDTYVKMDETVGKLVEKAGKDATVIIISDHGMGPLYKDVFINNWLMREGFMHLKKGARTRIKKALHDLGLTMENAYQLAQSLNLAKHTAKSSEKAEKARQFLLDHLFISFKDVDWSRTVAFSATNYGPIFINLKGRQEEGIVEEEEYEGVRDHIITRLKHFLDEKGEKVMERVWTREEVASGPHLGEAPDIIFEIRGMKYTSNRYFEFASNKLFGNPHRGMSGDHRNDGIFLAYGNNITRSGKPVEAKMADLVPTILHILGEPIPNDVDGRVLKEIFKQESDPAKREPKAGKAAQLTQQNRALASLKAAAALAASKLRKS